MAGQCFNVWLKEIKREKKTKQIHCTSLLTAKTMGFSPIFVGMLIPWKFTENLEAWLLLLFLIFQISNVNTPLHPLWLNGRWDPYPNNMKKSNNRIQTSPPVAHGRPIQPPANCPFLNYTDKKHHECKAQVIKAWITGRPSQCMCQHWSDWTMYIFII